MKDEKIIDFSIVGEQDWWEKINDTVMGGLSEGRIIVAGGLAVFEGNVSLENFGGFASVRSLPRGFDLGDYDGLIIKVRGDGKRYRLRLKTDDDFEGLAYQAAFFTAPAEWTEPRLSFGEFVPVFRGAVVTGSPPLEPSKIVRIGFMIADRQQGPFRLEIKEVRAYLSEE